MTQLNKLSIPTSYLSGSLPLSIIAAWWPHEKVNTITILEAFVGYRWGQEVSEWPLWNAAATWLHALRLYPNLHVLYVSDIEVPFPYPALNLMEETVWLHSRQAYILANPQERIDTERNTIHEIFDHLPHLRTLCYEYLQPKEPEFQTASGPFVYLTIGHRERDSKGGTKRDPSGGSTHRRAILLYCTQDTVRGSWEAMVSNLSVYPVSINFCTTMSFTPASVQVFRLPEMLRMIGRFRCPDWRYYNRGEILQIGDLAEVLALRTVSKSFLEHFIPPFPRTAISISSVEQLIRLFRDVIAYEKHCCYAPCSNSKSEPPDLNSEFRTPDLLRTCTPISVFRTPYSGLNSGPSDVSDHAISLMFVLNN
ncbi:hypothetical protein OH77DRAFT_1440521 [Trametes cingulata]|nr:hypothetical protein OH77DRAFT_1440521 [Trametes cingulata]